ncbi:putative rlpA-like protein, double-psi beta-barrel [Dioscorea sansibarensis]
MFVFHINFFINTFIGSTTPRPKFQLELLCVYLSYFQSNQMTTSVLYLVFSSLLLSFACACDRCVHQSKASHSTSSLSIAGGACGYGPIALDFNGGYVAAASPALYKNGAGCGGCFQIRCKNSKLCRSRGVKVVLTDLNPKDNQTDFILSPKAFMALGRSGMAPQLKKLGTVDIEYKRIPCEYKKHNLTVRVEETSQKPSNLSISLLYQGGQTEILTVDVAQVGSGNWRFMSRRGITAIWDMSDAPTGGLQLRIAVTGGFDPAWIITEEVLQADWKIGSVYDSGSQITEIAQELCSPCDTKQWK